MNCPVCMHKDFFVNFLGPDCLNPRCRHFKNGSKDGISAAELASRKPNRPFDVGDHIVFDRGASWTDGKEPDGVMLLGMIVAHHPDGIPEPFWKVRLLEDSEFPGKYIVGAGTDLGVYPRFMEWPD